MTITYYPKPILSMGGTSIIHHKDGNHYNNSPDNWEILCKKCHQHHHSKTDDRGRFVSEKV